MFQFLTHAHRYQQAGLQLLFAAFACLICASAQTLAHPLGNFTINHYARLELGETRVRLRFVVDMAEISTLQELQALDKNSDGTPTRAALDAYAERAATEYVSNLVLIVDGARVPLLLASKQISLPAGQGGLPTLRLECDLTGALDASSAGASHYLHFEDRNHLGRIGWHEIVVKPESGVNVFNSSAKGNGITDELHAYPTDMLTAPLDERNAELSFTSSALPAGAKPLFTRDGRKVEVARDRLAELIAVPQLTFGLALLGLVIAAALGGFHALSPGHGKTIVAAYLIGSRGTAKHAAFLGLTVTVTHTAGVFALGLVTLFAAQYIVPERLYPILSLVSGAIVVIIGLGLFVKRLGATLGFAEHDHTHGGHTHEDEGDASMAHSHGGREHTHLPPGTNGGAITWRSLLALGISGGLLPCPSALVVLLSAIMLHRIGYGLLLVVAFSFGLASVLTSIGLLFVYARRYMERPLASAGWLVRVLPIFSAFVITCVGLGLCYEALGQAGYSVSTLVGNLIAQFKAVNGEPTFASMSALAILGLGLVFGLKHATEVDHVVAVTTIVSEHRKLWRAALVGALWGAGHTVSLIIVGAVVLALRVAIPERVGDWLEFGVALMIIGLGANAVANALRKRSAAHVHKHRHDGLMHAHIHFHEQETAHADADAIPAHTHALRRVGIKPLIVGAMHGLAGSAALTLLVLAQIPSPLLGLLYLSVFGFGSIIGMLLMSGLVGLPFVLSARKLTGIHYGLQTGAGAFSICFGLWYAYQTGIASGLLSAIL